MRFLTFSWANSRLCRVASPGCVVVGSKFGVGWGNEVSGQGDVVGVAQEKVGKRSAVSIILFCSGVWMSD